MQVRLLALAMAAALAAGCVSNESKPDTAAAPAAASTTPAATAAAPAPTPAKPECKAEPAAKKTSKTTKKTSKKTEPAPVADCEPVKPKAEPATAGKPAETAAVTGSAAGKACNPCTVKSKDGTFDGEVYGTIPPGSKWSKLQIGMHQSEVERILGTTPNIRAYVTAKAWIPFYFGGDSHRYEAVYAGQGSVAYTGGSFGGGQGILMMINYDPKIQ